MSRVLFFAVPLLLSVALFSCESVSAKSLPEQVRKALQKRIFFTTEPHKVVCRGELLCGSAVLPRFYSLRNFSPAWLTKKGPRPEVTSFIQAISKAHQEGFNPQDYHLVAIEDLLEEIRHHFRTKNSIPLEKLVDLDLLLTDSFLLYASHLSAGRVNPETIQSEWFIKTHKVDLIWILQTALEKGRIEEALESICPQNNGYGELKKALAAYSEIKKNGGWSALARDSKMKKGDQGSRVTALRSRLTVTGDIESAYDSEIQLFDEAVEKAVLKYQHRCGLKEDGIVGQATRAALNVPVEDRIDQIKINMERWRWLPQSFGPRYVLVNIADFQLNLIENSSSVLNMRVVVGKKYRRTPVFTGKMVYIVVNPYWNIPHKLAIKDFLPRIKKESEFLKKQGIRVFESWKKDAQEIDPKSLDWSQINRYNFHFKLRQDPGPLNALGQLKFVFPNKFSVYLHDSPAKGLFEETKRDFSSGCIRIEKPVDLAVYLLKSKAKWTREGILEAIAGLKTRNIRLPEPTDIQILYLTAWVDSEGFINFRDDIYARDKRLKEALNERSPVSQGTLEK